MPLMNIFPQLARNLLMRCRRQLTATKVVTDQRFCFNPENSSQVFSQLTRIKLSKSKAIVLDKISARLIRGCADLFAFLFARSLIVLWLQAYSQMTGNVLKLLLYSSRELKFEWYEQLPTLSVISVVAKVFEWITYDQVYAYLSEHKITLKSQSGFHYPFYGHCSTRGAR